MDVAHVHVEAREYGHRLAHRVGNVVELQVEEDAVSPALDLAHDLGTLGIEELHADLQEGFALLVPEQVEEAEGVFCGLEVAGYDYVAFHIVFGCFSVRFSVRRRAHSTQPMMSRSRSIPRRSISAGRASMISFEA